MNQKLNRLVCGVSCFVFLILVVLIKNQIKLVQPIDDHIRLIVNSNRTPILNSFFITVTKLFNTNQTLILFAITLVLSWHLISKRFGTQALVTISSGLILNRLIKEIVRRPRPYSNVLMHYSGFSFPSGHSSVATVILGILILIVIKKCHQVWLRNVLTIATAILIIIIGCSRIYVGAHYPSDVLAGWCLGLICLSAWNLFFNK